MQALACVSDYHPPEYGYCPRGLSEGEGGQVARREATKRISTKNIKSLEEEHSSLAAY